MSEQNKEILENFIQYIEKISMYLPNSIESMRKRNISEAVPELIDLIEGLEWIDRVFTNTDVFGSIDPKVLNPIYREMQEAMENQDFALLADILEYDFLPAVIKLKDQVMKIV